MSSPSGGSLTMPRYELFLILTLGAALMSTSLPMYSALARSPEDIFFGEGVFVMSQASAGHPLTPALVEDLRSQEWAMAVSPEVYAFIALEGAGVVVRGIEADAFLSIEGAAGGLELGSEFLLVGHRLARDLGVRSGDTILLPGSLRPRLMEARVDAILEVPGAPADEFLLDLPRARDLAGLGSEAIILMRVKAEDGQKLLDYLVSADVTALVGDGQVNLRVEEGRVLDDRLGGLILTRPELARELGRSYVSTFAQYSGNSLRVLVLGMQGLTFTLFFLMLVSTLVRALVEARRDIGLIVALGGRFRALLSSFGGRILLLGIPAGFVGVALGAGVGRLLEVIAPFAFFGHTLRYTLEPWQAVLLLALYLVVLLLALLLSLLFLLRQHPRDLLYEPPEHRFEEVRVG